MKLTAVKTDNKFIPAYDSDYEQFKKIGNGELVKIEYIKTRNYEFHKKFFALLRVVLEFIPEQSTEFKTEDDLLFYLKMKLGYFKKRVIDGKIAYEPNSISFSRMGEKEFQDFYDRSLDVILNLIDADKEIIENELIGFM